MRRDGVPDDVVDVVRTDGGALNEPLCVLSSQKLFFLSTQQRRSTQHSSVVTHNIAASKNTTQQRRNTQHSSVVAHNIAAS